MNISRLDIVLRISLTIQERLGPFLLFILLTTSSSNAFTRL
jgi:hypothetical protein